MLTKEIQSRFNTLYIIPEALKRIMYYAQAATGEVSGLGTISVNEKKQLIVDKVYLLEQESSAGDTELKPEAISQLMTTMLQGNEDPGRLKFWWHSHANMGVFWSGTDDTCAETLSREYAFSMVVNKSGDKKCRLDLYHPFRLTLDNLKIEEVVEEDATLKEECKKEVEDKVKNPAYNNHNYGGMWNHGDNRNWRGNYYGHNYNPNASTDIDVKEPIADDIKRLIKLTEENATKGGAFSIETWEEYIGATLKSVVQARFESKADCNSFATWGENFNVCGTCKVVKACKMWTRTFEKTPGAEEIIVEDLSARQI